MQPIRLSRSSGSSSAQWAVMKAATSASRAASSASNRTAAPALQVPLHHQRHCFRHLSIVEQTGRKTSPR
ncbi:MAG: hypothetical protein ACLVD8_26090 [Enterocloster sp.]|uniref:hypothetical protein n=1 Tax=Enterocloster sp. TaxID=2719315 RepID=UPI00399A61A0